MHFPIPILTLRAPHRPSHSIYRSLCSSIRTMSSKHDINYSSNSDPAKVAAELSHLADGQGRWNISATKSGVEREFKFKTFKTTWAFMNKVAEEAGKKRHHPEWSNVCLTSSPFGQNTDARAGLQHNIHPLDYTSPAGTVTVGCRACGLLR